MYTLQGKSITITVCTFILAITGLFIFDGTTNESLALTTADCRACHTDAYIRHHSIIRGCAACHKAGTPTLNPDDGHQDRDCVTCHYFGTIIYNAVDVTTAHAPLHDMTDVPDPVTCNISCHSPSVIDEHTKYPSFAAPDGEMDCDRCHLNTNTDPLLGPINVQETIALGDGGATGQVVTCDQCHTNITPQGHAASHDNVLPNPEGCATANCHDTNVMTEHTNRGWTCNTCHNGETLSLDPATVQQVITNSAGPYDPSETTTAYCTDCHGTDAGTHAADHDQGFFLATPSSQDCSQCHAPMDPAIDTNWTSLVDEHVTNRGFVCGTCHDRVDHVFDAINKGRTPSNLPIYCVDCHTDETTGQGTGHNPISADAEPWNRCGVCHFINIYGIPLHNMHEQAALDMQQDCTVCHVPAGTRPDCILCHALDQTIWDPLMPHQDTPTNDSLNIIGPGTEDHDKHTSGPIVNNCEYCHVSGIPGGEPLPIPYNECSRCHDGATGSDITYGSAIHTVSHVQGAEEIGQGCSYCHSQAPACTDCHEIAGPNTVHHETHTETLQYDCAECHVTGIAGSEPLPEPFDQCSSCHNSTGPGSDIIYGSTIHTTNHIAEGEISGQSCDLCHSPVMAPDCAACHAPGHPPMTTPYDECVNCHDGTLNTTNIAYGQVGHNLHMLQTNNNCSACHVPEPDCSVCHIPSHDPVPVQFASCDDCHATLQPNQTTHDAHKVAATTNNIVDCTVCHSVQATCADCHSPGHEPVPAQFQACDQCHMTLQPTEAIHNAHKAAATTNNIVDCTVCHSDQATCTTCHSPGHPEITTFDACAVCHTEIQPGTQTHNNHRAATQQDCTVCHTASSPDCSTCHTGTTHTAIPAPYNACDDCHTTLQPTQAVHEAHKTAATEGGIVNCATCHTAQPDCSSCHNSQPHGPIAAPYNECSNCHTGIVYGQTGHNTHITAANNDCTTCHTAQPNCASCHTAGHDPVPAAFQACDSCHTTLQPTETTHEAHKIAATTNNIVDCTVCHTAQATCSSCHSPGHATIPAPNNGCDECHLDIQPGSVTHEAHKTQANNNCATCHNAAPDCGACHTAGNHNTEHNNLGATETCAICHTDKINGTNFQYISTYHPPLAVYGGSVLDRCETCHTSTRTEVIDTIANGKGDTGVAVGCVDCHTATHPAFEPSAIHDNLLVNTGSTCSNCHIADYETHTDMTTSTLCSGCHVSTTQTEINTLHNDDCMICHLSPRPEVLTTITTGIAGTQVDCTACHTTEAHEQIPAPNNACDDCHTDIQPGSATHESHKVAATTGGVVNCALCHTSSPAPNCGQCHTAGNHNLAHDNAGVPSTGCTNCHDANVVVEHVDNRSFTCATCHDSTDPNVSSAIDAGKAGTFVTCYDCHGQNNHHATLEAQNGNCAHCHADPRPLTNDPQQLACRECHLDNNGYVQTSTPAPSHAFNTNGNIQDFGACFDCHAPVPFHGKTVPQQFDCWDANPQSPTYDPNIELPGRGTFNLFYADYVKPDEYYRRTSNEELAKDYCRRNQNDFDRPTISYSMYQIVYQGQTMAIPVFDSQYDPFPTPSHNLINTVGNCGNCHTVGDVVSITHNNNCQACHMSNDQIVQSSISLGRSGTAVDCFSCHGSQDHVSAHDMTELTEPSCAECHVPNVFTEHVANHTLTCSHCHSSTDPNVQGAITNGMNGNPVPCQDCHGNNAGDHLTAHDSVGVPSAGCTNCHDANVITEHVTNRGFVCADCHNNSTYDTVITAGQAGTFVTCYDCHGQGGGSAHHDNDNARTGNCSYCHADPRLEIDPNAPTGQLACRQCHVDNNGFVTTSSSKPSHAFNTQGNIQDFGACFDCHQPTPYHAKPTSRPRDCQASTADAPGKGSFNLFSSEFGGGGEHNERNDSCEDRERDYRDPAISFNMVTIVDQLGTNRQYSVPTFGSSGGGGGGGTQNDSVEITSASYSSRRDRVRVYAENTLGESAQLTVMYDGRSYDMYWDSSNNRWEIDIRTSHCDDSTIEVESSAGGSDSSSVSGCDSH